MSPPICDVLFSSSSGPVIVLNPLGHLTGVTGVIAGGSGRFSISWDSYPGALCYSVYKATDSAHPETSEYIIVAECIPGTIFEPITAGCYRISAITTDGETPLSNPICSGNTFGPPDVITDDAMEITSASARLNGQANPSGFPTSAYFQYGLSTGYGINTAPQDMGDSTIFSPFLEDIVGLSGNTTYHFRAVGVNANGTAYGEDKSFTTPGGGGGGIPVPSFYWEMEELALADRTDSVQGILLSDSYDMVGGFTDVAGKIDTGIEMILDAGSFTSGFITTNDSSPREPGLKCDANGWSFCGWTKSSVLEAGQNFGAQVAWVMWNQPNTQIGVVAITWKKSFGQLVLLVNINDSLNNNENIDTGVIPPDTFTFFRVWWDATDGKVRILLNETGVPLESGVKVYAASASGQFYISCGLGTGFTSTHVFDELGVWQPALSDAEAALLYNGGAGTRPPFA